MAASTLSDEEIYSALEIVLTAVLKHLPVRSPTPLFPDQEILEQLQQKYNPKTCWAFFRACYWHLADNGIMAVDSSLRYHLTETITEDKKNNLCMKIFSEYERFINANHQRSLKEPDPYTLPKIVPDSSPETKWCPLKSGGK